MLRFKAGNWNEKRLFPVAWDKCTFSMAEQVSHTLVVSHLAVCPVLLQHNIITAFSTHANTQHNNPCHEKIWETVAVSPEGPLQDPCTLSSFCCTLFWFLSCHVTTLCDFLVKLYKQLSIKNIYMLYIFWKKL